MMNNMGGEDDLPDVDGADDVRELFKPKCWQTGQKTTVIFAILSAY